MKDNNANTVCSYSDEVVSYIYNELASDARDLFESHLEHCSGCVDELAAVSLSHFEVSEWRKIEFEPLATPVFTLPHRVTMLQRLQGLFGFTPQWLTTAGAMASLVVFAAAGLYVASNYTGDDEVAAVAENRDRPTSNAQRNAIPVVDPTGTTQTSGSEIVEPVQATKMAPDKAVTKKRESSDTPKTVRVNSVTEPRNSDRMRKVPAAESVSNPRLGDFDDEEDESLRLSDLFADIDTRD